MTILAIETSCDETSCAILKDDTLLSNIVSTQMEVHAQYGGVMPEVASRLHIEKITIVINEALESAGVSLDDIDAFAVTRGPGLVGALHVGLVAAKTLAMLYKKPLIPVHHLAAHIYANAYVKPLQFPLLALVVSGGNTELVYMKEDLDFKIIGETRDDAIGECYDKVARVLGLSYPGGVPIDNLAKRGKCTYKLPRPLHSDGTYDFSYSGLKTNVINLVHSLEQKGEEVNVPDMCASFQKVAIAQVVDKTIAAIKDYNIKNVVVCGGVSANSYLRERMSEECAKLGVDLTIPPLWCTTDNAAMVAKLGARLYEKGICAPLSVAADPNWRIEDYKVF
ncbi:MAG: tRNA (adenosine(37)-N6)-threonylcarbamoyltransferase complex transferase subunit TsaD [Coprobacillus sp.]|nr:tRNA (adenosine(37)-N6)-threonylcarbamoyltransferase complex transferase subunit TsaD [Coprobacillus sp.]